MRVLLAAHLMVLETGASEKTLIGRIFGLDLQVIFDALITACAVFFLFFLMSYLVFNPARDLLKKRQERIAGDLATAAQEKEDAMAFKAEYDARLKQADKDVDAILSEGKKKAMRREEAIIGEANAEAARIMERTEREIALEKSKVKDEIKTEMIAVAKEMAGRFVSEEMDDKKQAAIVDDVLKEMGEHTWQE